jgi:hypothetical protein
MLGKAIAYTYTRLNRRAPAEADIQRYFEGVTLGSGRVLT